jgi:hypothetical protein
MCKILTPQERFFVQNLSRARRPQFKRVSRRQPSESIAAASKDLMRGKTVQTPKRSVIHGDCDFCELDLTTSISSLLSP